MADELTLATIPLGHLDVAIQVASVAVKQRQAGLSWEQIAVALEPSAIQIVETVANIFFPGAGTIIEIVLKLHSMEVPQTQEQIPAWMDRFGLGNNTA